MQTWYHGPDTFLVWAQSDKEFLHGESPKGLAPLIPNDTSNKAYLEIPEPQGSSDHYTNPEPKSGLEPLLFMVISNICNNVMFSDHVDID